MAQREPIALACEICGHRNYRTTKARVPGQTEVLSLRKYCAQCNQHTMHVEAK